MSAGLIRPVRPGDAAAVCGIYNPYVLDTAISFEELAVDPGEMERRIAAITAAHPWLVLEEEGRLLGYAYAHNWKERSAYRFSAESSVYVDRGRRGEGLGRRLMEALIGELRAGPTHALIAVITLPNEASVGLHEGLGFRKAAHFSEVGWKMGRWRDVGYWELLLTAEA